MLKISYVGCLSSVIWVQLTLQMCVAAWNPESSLKRLIMGVKSRSRSSMLIPPKSSSAVPVMIRSKSVPICNRSHARWANSGKITISDGYPLWCPSSRGISSPSGMKFGHKKTRDPRLSYGGNPESLSYLRLNRYRVVTPGWTDRRTDRQNYDS